MPGGTGKAQTVMWSPKGVSMQNDRIRFLRCVLAVTGFAVCWAPVAVAGRLAFVGVHRYGVAGVEELLGSQRLAIAPDGLHLYVPGFDSQILSVFTRAGSTGALVLPPQGVTISAPSAVTVSPDGAHVYATAQAGGVEVYSRNAGTGALMF